MERLNLRKIARVNKRLRKKGLLGLSVVDKCDTCGKELNKTHLHHSKCQQCWQEHKEKKLISKLNKYF